jgi:DNA-binding MarR family transcriptional regulator
MDRALGALGLTAPQYAVLAALEEAPGIPSAELARRSFVTPQTMQAIVAGLETRGLLARAANPGHGRALATDLTEEGRRLVRRAHAAVEAIESQMTSGLSNHERRQLSDLLERCALALEH